MMEIFDFLKLFRNGLLKKKRIVVGVKSLWYLESTGYILK